MEKKHEIKQPVKQEIIEFTKEQLMKSNKFKNDRDILSVVMNDNEKVSSNEAQKRIENFKKGMVK